ncbi:MAG: efflux RND transporter periplasmic adaptor subunit [Elusimicrobia bacterium]|nr:efflux RND transporter periplasmic adaptor subunit [Elusimicrobiota bacterium]
MRRSILIIGPAAALAAALLAAGVSSGHEVATVGRKDVEFQVVASGTVVADDVFRLKSSIEGRVEAVAVSVHTWVKAKTPLGFLANKEVSAIIDARGSTPQEILQERWQKLYKPVPILCPSDCFVLKAYVKERQRVMPNALLFEAAKTFRLVGRVGSEAAGLVKAGQKVKFWPVDDPSRKMEGKIADYAGVGWGDAPGRSFALDVSNKGRLYIGTEWEGVVLITARKNILAVPTSALIAHEGSVYLPVKVSTGSVIDDLTEIGGGAEEGTTVLIIGRSQAGSAPRRSPDKEAPQSLTRRAPPQEAPDKAQRPPQAPEPHEDPYGEEDPYSE